MNHASRFAWYEDGTVSPYSQEHRKALPDGRKIPATIQRISARLFVVEATIGGVLHRGRIRPKNADDHHPKGVVLLYRGSLKRSA